MAAGSLLGAVSSVAGGSVVGRAVVQFVGDTRQLEQSFAKTNAAGQTTATTATKQASTFSTAWKIAGVAAGAALIKFLSSSVKAAQEAQRVQAQTNAVIASTGGAANISAQGVSELAGRLQDLSGVEDENIQSGLNMLLTFKNIRNETGQNNDIFTQASEVLVDMSVAFQGASEDGTSMIPMAVKLGKALNDPIKGVTALTRVGVTFTQQQKDQITTLTNTGRSMQAQRIILRELNSEFGGSAEAMGDTFAGAQARLANNFNDMQESIGLLIIRGLEPLVGFLNTVVELFNKLPQPMQDGIALAAILATGIIAIGSAVGLARGALANLGVGIGQSAAATQAAAVATTEYTVATNAAAVATDRLAVSTVASKTAMQATQLQFPGMATGAAQTGAAVAGAASKTGMFSSALSLVGGPIGAFIIGVAALTYGAKKLSDALYQSGIDELHEKLTTQLIPAFEQGEASAWKFVDVANRSGEVVGDAGISNEQYATALNQIAEGYLTGSVKASTWAAAVDEANDRGIDATQILMTLRAEQLANNLATAEVQDTFRRFGSDIENFTAIAGTSLSQFRRDLHDAFKEGPEAVDEFTTEMAESFMEFRTDVQDTFTDVDGILSTLADRQNLSAERIIGTFRRQANQLKAYTADWREVRREVGPEADELLAHVQDLGLDGALFLDTFANASDKDQTKIVKAFGNMNTEGEDLGTVISKTLVPSIHKLIDSIREAADLPPIDWKFNADTSGAQSELDNFTGQLVRAGFEPTTATQGGIGGGGGGKGGKNGGKVHKGGRVPQDLDTRGRSTALGGDEVAAVLKQDEFVVRAEVAKKRGVLGMLRELNAGHIVSEYHDGGVVKMNQDVNAMNADMTEINARIQNPPPATYSLPASFMDFLPDFIFSGVAPGGLTAPAAKAYAMVKAMFPTTSIGGKAIRTISGSNTWSQHAYGNALDIFSPVKQNIADWLHAQAGPMSVAELIYNYRDSYKGGAWGPYTGTTNPHTDHVHSDFSPWWTGDPYTDGRPVGHKGGMLRRSGNIDARRGEVIVEPEAPESVEMMTRALVAAMRKADVQRTTIVNLPGGIYDPDRVTRKVKQDLEWANASQGV